jgi:tungstate transport system substrate-binding protein
VTTHSLEDSGLLEVLAEAFHAHHPDLRLSATAVGSGAALEIGRRGDADVLLTHDPDGEREFMAAGAGEERGAVMENRYLLVGPPSDPAGIAGESQMEGALRAIARSGARFLSRGDDSGTHRRERALWRAAGLEPWTTRPVWYVEAGLGMAETLQTADQLDAYVLTDDGTFLHLSPRLALAVIVSADPVLINPYSYILPARARNREGARRFAAWLTGPGQAIIRDYGQDRFGRPLFEATADRETEED